MRVQAAQLVAYLVKLAGLGKPSDPRIPCAVSVLVATVSGLCTQVDPLVFPFFSISSLSHGFISLSRPEYIYSVPN